MIEYDGHVHSPFCPHGTKDTFEDYIKQAVKLGCKGMTFTEHAPLPPSFDDPVPDKDSAMDLSDLNHYITELQNLKEKYKNELDIRIGLEVDYIEAYEEETRLFLNEVGPVLDDAILSVHFLKINDRYTCLDYSPGMFNEAITASGSLEAVYDRYFSTVLSSIKADLGSYKPNRIGHITLVKKFQKRFPASFPCLQKVLPILTEVKKHSMTLDVNGAGFIKPLCGESYPSSDVLRKAAEMKIPCVYGSDSHSYKQLGSGYVKLKDQVPLTPPAVYPE
ncbi:histidinol-phosphatase HisJ [Alteribacter keqinensis]|uniref:Histidinol-phosphatase n=1 Tax=Alteribacter keqinensis TaxID=2483800 RepID=A0A3M7U037_9BACI|nr:histidinol-phosphatase HisJ [Alteribacter keqinensis]RNA70364.1 histidinol-phosphatase HisJ [Alteribacter keqinensis]